MDMIIPELKKILSVANVIEKENAQNYFDANKEFFVIDSNNIKDIKTKIYGYAVQENGIIENQNLTEKNINQINGCGCYVLLEKKCNQIKISQDFNGSYGLFLFRYKNYFAISNSFFMLVDHIKHKYPLSFNRDFANYMIAMDLCSHAISDTMVNEIKILQKNAVIQIDIRKKSLNVDFIDYKENSVSIDTPEGLDILDKWFKKWTTIIRNIKSVTNDIQLDLSGGFDSRLTFLLALKSKINLNEITVNSVNGKVHTLAEDYEIATEIANYFNIKLNKKTNSTNISYNYSLSDILNICVYNKITLHKQMYYKLCRFKDKHFIIPGHGGEAVRSHWDEPVHSFKEQYYKKINKYEKQTQEEILQSFNNIMDKDIKEIAKQHNIKDLDSKELLIYLYRDTRNRNHFGRGCIDDFFANVYNLEPLLDPELLKLKLCTSDCKDNNLLISVFYTRYCPELLDFRFQGNRHISKQTIEFAKEINKKNPPKMDELFEEKNDKLLFFKDNENIINKNKTLNKDELNNFFKDVFDSDSFAKTLNAHFNSDIYYKAKEYMEKTQHFPLSEIFPLIGISLVINALGNNKKIYGKYSDYIKSFKNKSENEAEKLKYSWEYVKNNILTQTPKEITCNDITSKTSGRLSITIGETKFESVLIPSGTKKLYVFLSAVGKKAVYPIFNRISWCDKFDGVCLFLDDPTRYEFNFAPAYYFGSASNHYLRYVLEIVNRLAEVYGITNEDITFISSSNGGFAALWLSDLIKNSRCFSFCPQIDVVDFVTNKLKISKESIDVKRLSLKHILQNKSSHFFIYSNIRSQFDKTNMEYLFGYVNQDVKLGISNLTPNLTVLVVDIPGKDPHAVQPDKFFTYYLSNDYYYHPNDQQLQLYIKKLEETALQELIKETGK